ncbi:MAG: hypothetical protein ACI9EF_000115 [Pseudohongiellaceae bacterium]|jgi:hypothetical protein
MSSLSIRRLVSGLRARYHVWSGRRAYRIGKLDEAGRHLDEAVSQGHESFAAFLLLGKIAFRERDHGRAAECFSRARLADPARYALEGYPEDFISGLRELPAGKAPRLRFRIVIEATSLRTSAAEPASRAPKHPRSVMGDFSSKSELARHRDQPTIQPGEGADVDWDAAADQLFEA